MVLPIITALIGAIFLYAGISILVFRNYSIISDYTPSDGEGYARRVGIVETVCGALTLGGGIVGIFWANETASWFILLGCISLTIALLSLLKKK